MCVSEGGQCVACPEEHSIVHIVSKGAWRCLLLLQVLMYCRQSQMSRTSSPQRASQ